MFALAAGEDVWSVKRRLPLVDAIFQSQVRQREDLSFKNRRAFLSPNNSRHVWAFSSGSFEFPTSLSGQDKDTKCEAVQSGSDARLEKEDKHLTKIPASGDRCPERPAGERRADTS